jgi:hypothetical protein
VAQRCSSVLTAKETRTIVSKSMMSRYNNYYCQHSSSSRASFATLRRSRRYLGAHDTEGNMPPSFGRLEEPYQHGENNMEEYLSKTSLSPWAPIPDSVARKVFDVAQAKPEDIHVDLGSGDGRVNFHAIDYGVKRSIGIDVDENIVKLANDRLAKRHPPPDLEFHVADLLDENHKVWEKVQEATIITMYFAEEALEKFRPLLEKKLMGRECKVITCGYEMPGWDSSMQEVVLGTQIHLYEWGKEMDDDDAFLGEDILKEKPLGLMEDVMNEKFAGSNVIDKTGRHPIRGFDPNADDFDEAYDTDWDAEDSSEEEEPKKEKSAVV